jgi:hypothetical protein
MKNYTKTDGNGKITFVEMGCNISELNYNGDLNNHRIRSYINYNGVDILIEITSCRTIRTTTKNGKTLKKPIQTSYANGLHIVVYGMHTEIIQSMSGKWFSHDTEKLLFEKHTGDRHDKTTHTKKHALLFINTALRSNFTELEIVKG